MAWPAECYYPAILGNVRESLRQEGEAMKHLDVGRGRSSPRSGQSAGADTEGGTSRGHSHPA